MVPAAETNGMEILFLILLIVLIDALSFLTITGKRITGNSDYVRVLVTLHLLFSLITYYLLIKAIFHKGDFSDTSFLTLNLHLALFISAIWLQRIIIVILSNTGYILRRFSAGLAKTLNISGLVISALIFLVLAAGYINGRFNFKVERIGIQYDNLSPSLDGLRIVHISDLHLSSFHRKEKRLIEVVQIINDLNPDLILNTGDFVTIASHEMEPFTSILAELKSEHGKYAVTGNHDEGTYHPDYNESDRINNFNRILELIVSSGFLPVTDTAINISIHNSELTLIGNRTSGSIPNISYSNIDHLLADSVSTDFRILLSHDPNWWSGHINGKYSINLTLSGHTHGAQLGFRFGKSRWSPAKKYYAAWHGLYGAGDCWLYVNSGLGTIGIPVRIGMPPEITLITINKSGY